MSGFETNKIAAAILITLLALKSIDLIVDAIIKPQTLEKNAFEIEGVAVLTQEDKRQEGTTQSIEPLLAKANIKNGEKVFKKCSLCHTLDKGGANKAGPNLYNVIGEKGEHEHEHKKDFTYSPAMLSQSGGWTYKQLSDFLENPRKVLPGTKMGFIGLKKPQDRADVIAYMRQYSDNPPLP